MHLPAGQMIGNRYQVDSLLGQGGMSYLYLARDQRHQSMVVVIKEMNARFPDPKDQEQAEALFMREAQLLSDLNHPHIPKVFDKFMFQGKYYLSMEYVKGEDLGKKLSRAPAGLPERQVAEWGAQMATVLYYLHKHQPPIVFRDVKPSNMMISDVTQGVKLIDFGIARLLHPNKKGDTMRIGSPGYAPPEQYTGQSDPRSDIYALGVTLHHALTGRDPTTTQTPFLLPPARTLNAAITPAMAAIVEKATQLDPDKRYADMILMKRDLQEVLRSHGVIASQTAPNMGLGTAAAPVAPTPATPVAVTPTATPTPVPAPAPGVTVTTKPAQKGSWTPALLLTAALAGSVATAVLAPSVVDDSRRGLAVFMSHLLHQKPPTEPGPAGIYLYREGGPLPLTLDLLAQGRKKTPTDALLQLTWSDALAFSGTTKTMRLAVVLPQGQEATLRGVALAQSLLNEVGGIEQTLLLVETTTYAAGKLPQALSDAQAGRAARKTGKASPPDGLLVFGDQAPDGQLPTVVVSDADVKANALPKVSADPAALIAAGLPAEATSAVWLLTESKAPEKGKVHYKPLPAPTDAGSVAAFLKGAGASWVIADVAQAKLLLEKPDPSLHLLVWSPQSADLPAIDKQYTGDKGPTLLAVTGSSQLCADGPAAGFWREFPAMFGNETLPDSEAARAYDGARWCALKAKQSSSGYAGVTVRLDAEGKARAGVHSRWSGSAQGWLYNLDLAEAGP